MSTTVTTHSTSVLVAPHSTSSTKISSSISSIDSNMPPTHLSVSGMSGLLNSRNLVQDEKLVVATLATLDSGSASNLIKQDLKLIIQSRRKAEGKAEIQVEFKKPVKAELTTEELTKRARRRELNRLAARRSREKGQRRKDKLVEEIRILQSENSNLVTALSSLTEERNSIISRLRQHMRQCSDYQATQNAAVGMSQRVLQMLGFQCEPESGGSAPPTPVTIKEEPLTYEPTYTASGRPVVLGFSGKPLLTESGSDLSPTGSETVASVPPSPSTMSSQEILLGVSTGLSCHSLQGLSEAAYMVEEPVHVVLSSTDTLCGSSSQDSSPLPSQEWSSRLPSTPSSSSEEDPSLYYRHKLMKHRKDFPKPAPVPCRGPRASLERSFSFPSSSSETRPSVGIVSPGPTTRCHKGATALSASNPVLLADDQEAPLDLRQKHSEMDLDSSGFSSRSGLERRWSVDETYCQTMGQPDPVSLSPSSSNSRDGSTCIASRYAKLKVDSFS